MKGSAEEGINIKAAAHAIPEHKKRAVDLICLNNEKSYYPEITIMQ
jgi:hypothetical protein